MPGLRQDFARRRCRISRRPGFCQNCRNIAATAKPRAMELLTILLIAAVLCVPLAQRLGLGAIPGYLLAGGVIGPSGLGLVTDVPDIMRVSEWGVVMMLFVIGLELAPKRLWAMRREVFGAGTLQMVVCGALLGAVFGAGLRHLAGMGWQAAILCGLSLALSSTAVALRLLEERGLVRTPLGRSALGVLLLQDMAAIPMLVAAGLLGSDGDSAPSFEAALVAVVVVLACYRLRLLDWAARSQLHELFTAATLLVVLGTAQLFDYAGLSAGLGGFLVGMLLAESRHRNELEHTIEPFKGLLLGLFFLAVGMSVNVEEALDYWPYVLAGVVALLSLKALVLYGIARLMGLPHYHRLLYALVLAQGGEFSFVIFNEAWDNHLMSLEQRDLLAIVVAISMGAVPIVIRLLERLPGRYGGIGDMAVTPVGFAGSPPPQSAADNEERSGPG
ncbi:transporter, CPA2 family [Bordetella bronchiseptica E012]|uniref:Transporter, CPA2 family n=1 Tax=Bordetella bronchiseptica 00-P-2796 TaxID=1331199 RepID=A0ABR4RLD0_BORBO|nr:transporter, CPA2 family [Bordetella bronchiseptica 00-P-2796]KDB92753.1 transporter, CPA2 family [Bordetella bronchiseptica D993]KDB98691.1 transporter, CPA2 family [Bordetella bronchiseptica E010]KDC06540.1 transporter, CPA2 family [Bordetella bronchiseptica E012]KDC12385.1 transporter, CPA2 family [Bordetella bronchiseptica E013]KDC41814.1 transporter, CPA2 family [Bordetella bronchiseptica M435/02/3]KDC71766.1 transporter, CPA2 family [Bordetella bronchiseptica MBORD624]KDC76949.1 tra